jgi:hypothetical protein
MSARGRTIGLNTTNRLVGLFAAVLALVGQLILGALAPRGNGEVGGPPGSTYAYAAICKAGGTSHPGKAPHRQAPDDCGACPLCSATVQAALLLSPPVVEHRIPPVTTTQFVAPALPRAPPRHSGAPAYPTGPPTLT